MDILISNSSDKPIYEQICLQIKGLIMDGTLQPGEMLPSAAAGRNAALHARACKGPAYKRHYGPESI